MTTMTFDAKADVPHYVVQGGKTKRMVYIMTNKDDTFTVLDPFGVRPDSVHTNFNDAEAVATKFVGE